MDIVWLYLSVLNKAKTVSKKGEPIAEMDGDEEKQCQLDTL